MAGAAAAVSSRIGIATAATNHSTRHPVITATMAATAHRMSEGRYCFGLGRGFDVRVRPLRRPTGHQRPARRRRRGVPAAVARREVRPRRPRRDLPLPLHHRRARRPDPPVDGGDRAQVARPRRPHRGRRRASHVHVRRGRLAVGRHRPQRGRGGRSRPGRRPGLVVHRGDRGLDRRGHQAAQDRRPPRDLPAGLRRRARARQRLGPGRPAALPRARGRDRPAGRLRLRRHPGVARAAARRRHPRRVARLRHHRHRPRVRRAGARPARHHGRRQRDHARRHALPARARSSRPTATSARPTSLRCPPTRGGCSRPHECRRARARCAVSAPRGRGAAGRHGGHRPPAYVAPRSRRGR